MASPVLTRCKTGLLVFWTRAAVHKTQSGTSGESGRRKREVALWKMYRPEGTQGAAHEDRRGGEKIEQLGLVFTDVDRPRRWDLFSPPFPRSRPIHRSYPRRYNAISSKILLYRSVSNKIHGPQNGWKVGSTNLYENLSIEAVVVKNLNRHSYSPNGPYWISSDEINPQ